MFTLMDIPYDFSDEYYSYVNNNYIEFNNSFSITHMRRLADNDIANHNKEIDKDVTCVKFDKIYSYERRQIVVHQFDKIFQGIIDVDPSCTFSLSRYIHMELYKAYVSQCPYTQEHIASIVMTADPYIDSLTLCEMVRDRPVFSLTAKGLNYW